MYKGPDPVAKMEIPDNFSQVHQTLRMTPAMETGWTDHIWTVKELMTTWD